MIDRTNDRIDLLGFIFGIALTVMLGFTTLAPYIFSIRSPELIRQIDQTQGTIQNLCLILAGFLFGTSVGKRQQENIIATQATTIKTAQEALAPLAGATDTIIVEPGESKKVVGVSAELSGTNDKLGDNTNV